MRLWCGPEIRKWRNRLRVLWRYELFHGVKFCAILAMKTLEYQGIIWHSPEVIDIITTGWSLWTRPSGTWLVVWWRLEISVLKKTGIHSKRIDVASKNLLHMAKKRKHLDFSFTFQLQVTKTWCQRHYCETDRRFETKENPTCCGERVGKRTPGTGQRSLGVINCSG